VRFAFPHDIRGADGKPIQDGRLWVFTTRADTIMGVTFCAVAAEHPLAAHAARDNPKLAAFIEQCKLGGTSEAELALKDKEGLPTGLFVRHPLTDEKVEVWVGNYVLMGYGDGAVMGVPAHDERDFAFAKKYGIDILQVIEVDEEDEFSYDHWQEWYADKQRGSHDQLRQLQRHALPGRDRRGSRRSSRTGGSAARSHLAACATGASAASATGATPIPIIHCRCLLARPVPEKDLPVVLPEDLVPDGIRQPA
jgi:leucyl-tRNA synthetase